MPRLSGFRMNGRENDGGGTFGNPALSFALRLYGTFRLICHHSIYPNPIYSKVDPYAWLENDRKQWYKQRAYRPMPNGSSTVWAKPSPTGMFRTAPSGAASPFRIVMQGPTIVPRETVECVVQGLLDIFQHIEDIPRFVGV